MLLKYQDVCLELEARCAESDKRAGVAEARAGRSEAALEAMKAELAAARAQAAQVGGAGANVVLLARCRAQCAAGTGWGKASSALLRNAFSVQLRCQRHRGSAN